jgi:phospholipid/cholesterol/gamma-HCH transport system ATP-binding protein
MASNNTNETPAKPAMDSLEGAIQLQDVRKTFDGREYVLNGVNLNVPKGSITVLIGFSGTGKSVLLKHILGLLQPSDGRIMVLNEDIHAMERDELTVFRRKFGMLFQYAALFDDMNVIENVCFPLAEHRPELSQSDREQIAVERLGLVGLDPKHNKKLPSELSGGMRKRVGLARAIALDPDIIIYDEPTTGLDPVLTEVVDDLIVTTHKQRPGRTSLVVSHDLYASFRIGDYVAMLHGGKILLHGTPQDFLNTEIELVKRFVDKGVRK